MKGLTWTCHICKAERPDEKISVITTDRSLEFNLPPGTAKENVRYCNDNEACRKAALTHRLYEKKRR